MFVSVLQSPKLVAYILFEVSLVLERHGCNMLRSEFVGIPFPAGVDVTVKKLVLHQFQALQPLPHQVELIPVVAERLPIKSKLNNSSGLVKLFIIVSQLLFKKQQHFSKDLVLTFPQSKAVVRVLKQFGDLQKLFECFFVLLKCFQSLFAFV